MQINGGVRFCEQGMKASIRAMHVQSEILGMINDNVAGFDKVGFQRIYRCTRTINNCR